MARRFHWFFRAIAILALTSWVVHNETLTGLAGTAMSQRSPTWQQEWERVLAAAKQEGRVAVLAPTGSARRQVLKDLFEKKYGIEVQYSAGPGSAKTAQILAERRAGYFLWDVFVTGASTLYHLKRFEVTTPIEPALILPEVRDSENWQEGKLIFVDPEDRHDLVMLLGTREGGVINTKLVTPGDIKSYKDLLDPKWRGKIVVGRMPTVAGAGQSAFAFFYSHPGLGPEFIRTLAKQQLTFLGNDRQAGEWVATGKAAIGIGVGEIALDPFLKSGLPVAALDPRQIKEGSHTSPGAGSVALFNRAPRPNAAKVYLNWLLSREGQTAFSEVMTTPSRRADVPWNGDPAALPRPGHMELWGEKEAKVLKQLRPLLAEVFGF